MLVRHSSQHLPWALTIPYISVTVPLAAQIRQLPHAHSHSPFNSSSHSNKNRLISSSVVATVLMRRRRKWDQRSLRCLTCRKSVPYKRSIFRFVTAHAKSLPLAKPMTAVKHLSYHSLHSSQQPNGSTPGSGPMSKPSARPTH